jgi:hypothetical protein
MDEHQREIVGVVWKELGNRMVITYAEGEPEKVRAGELVPTRDGMARWAKDPDS